MKYIKSVLLGCLLPACLSAGPMTSKTKSAINNAELVILNKLKPSRLSADFNGDGKKDLVLFAEHKKSKKKGLCILHAGSHKCIVLGAGKKFYNGGDNFRWVDNWKIIPRGNTYETTFEPNGDVLGERKVVIENKGILLCVDEGGCGLVTYKKNKYIWIHQGD